jgi:hypothetical protein
MFQLRAHLCGRWRKQVVPKRQCPCTKPQIPEDHDSDIVMNSLHLITITLLELSTTREITQLLGYSIVSQHFMQPGG